MSLIATFMLTCDDNQYEIDPNKVHSEKTPQNWSFGNSKLQFAREENLAMRLKRQPET